MKNHLKRITAHRAVLIALLMAGCSLTGSALAQYVWVDEHGVKQFSDIAPPSDVPQSRILKEPHTNGMQLPSTPPSADNAKADDSAETAKAPMTTAEQNADYNKRRTEKAEKAKKDEAEAKRQADKADNCARATAYLAGLKNGVRMANIDVNGERNFLTDEQRAAEQEKAQSAIDSNCQ